ncbi:MAG: hypothetical protein R3C68_05585 [Myxococcota bacterium]
MGRDFLGEASVFDNFQSCAVITVGAADDALVEAARRGHAFLSLPDTTDLDALVEHLDAVFQQRGCERYVSEDGHWVHG